MKSLLTSIRARAGASASRLLAAIAGAWALAMLDATNALAAGGAPSANGIVGWLKGQAAVLYGAIVIVVAVIYLAKQDFMGAAKFFVFAVVVGFLVLGSDQLLHWGDALGKMLGG